MFECPDPPRTGCGQWRPRCGKAQCAGALVGAQAAGASIAAADHGGYVDGTDRSARFRGELGAIAIDAAGNVYVADGDNLAIHKITPAGVVTTLAR
jgi:hypothetical protein